MKCDYSVRKGLNKRLCRLALCGLNQDGKKLLEGSTEVKLSGSNCVKTPQFTLCTLCGRLFAQNFMSMPPNSLGYGPVGYRGGASSEPGDVGGRTS